MGQYGLITDGVIANVIEASAEFAESIDAVPIPDGFGIGDGFDAGIFVKLAPLVDLDQVKATLIAQIDADAERARLAHITGGAGQAMSYLQKAAEAKACLADAEPDAAAYPLLAAEVGITAPTLGEVAAVVAAAHAAWTVIGAQIEALRLGAKAAIAAATDAATAEAAAIIDWP